MLSVAIKPVTNTNGEEVPRKYELRWDYYDPNGKKRSKRRVFNGTPKQAQEEARKIELQVNNTEVVPIYETSHTVLSWLNWWIENVVIGMRDSSPETVENYQDEINNLTDYPIARIPLKKLAATPMALVEWWTAYKRRPNKHDPSKTIASGTAIQAWSVLNNALNEAVRLNQIPKNPMRQAFPERPKVVQVNPPRALSEDAYVAYSLAADKDVLAGALIHLALDTGLRREDAAGLKWSMVDLKERIIQIKVALVETKQGGRVFKPPKNEKAIRDLSISRKTADALRLHKARQVLEASQRSDWEDHDLVWPRRDGRPASPHALYQRMRLFQKRHGLGSDICLHELRHTMITNQLEDGVDPSSVAQRAGHSIRMTLNVYAHMKGRKKQKAMADLHDRLTGNIDESSSVVQ